MHEMIEREMARDRPWQDLRHASEALERFAKRTKLPDDIGDNVGRARKLIAEELAKKTG